jgi:hypothetical protein
MALTMDETIMEHVNLIEDDVVRGRAHAAFLAVEMLTYARRGPMVGAKIEPWEVQVLARWILVGETDTVDAEFVGDEDTAEQMQVREETSARLKAEPEDEPSFVDEAAERALARQQDENLARLRAELTGDATAS